jgi:hypothetical protein
LNFPMTGTLFAPPIPNFASRCSTVNAS